MKLELREFCETGHGARVDESAGVIKDVLVLGSKSRNNRVYSQKALRESAHKYNRIAVYVDHGTSVDRDRKGRAAQDRLGVLANVRYAEQNGGQLRGDLVCLTTHPLYPRLLEDLNRDMHLFGLSHQADGTGRVERDGTTIVESIGKVHSVDIVTSPATAVSLREQAAGTTAPAKRSAKRDVAPSDPKKLARWLQRG